MLYFFSCSPVGGHLARFYFSIVVNSVLMNVQCLLCRVKWNYHIKAYVHFAFLSFYFRVSSVDIAHCLTLRYKEYCS